MRPAIVPIQSYGALELRRGIRKPLLVQEESAQFDAGPIVAWVELQRLAQCRLGLGRPPLPAVDPPELAISPAVVPIQGYGPFKLRRSIR